MTGHQHPKRRAMARAGGAVVAVAALAGVASAQMEMDADLGAEFVDAVMSVAHIVGIVASLLLVYYAYRARKKFAGGVIGNSATYVMIGGLTFTIAFLNRELSHGFGVNLTGSLDMQMQMAVNMALFTVTVFAFGYAYYITASIFGGGR